MYTDMSRTYAHRTKRHSFILFKPPTP